MTEWHIFPVDKPDVGRKFIAVYNDGSGAQLFYAFDGGYLDVGGDEYDDVYACKSTSHRVLEL